MWDLTAAFTDRRLRPVRQRAGLLLSAATGNENGCLDFLKQRLQLGRQCVTEVVEQANLSDSFLFPSPEVDFLYRWLLISRRRREVIRLATHSDWHYLKALRETVKRDWRLWTESTLNLR